MRDEKQETIEDIVAEMRGYAKRCREENFGVPPAIERHYHEDDVEDLADRIEAALERMKKHVESKRADNSELTYNLAKQNEIIKQLVCDNERLIDENYHLRNEMRTTKKKEEDIKYEYAVEEKLGCWLNDTGAVFSSLDEAEDYMNMLCETNPDCEFRIVRHKIVNWEVVEDGE